MGKTKVNFFLFILLASLWSGSFIGIKAVVDYWPPIFGAALRVATGLFCLIILMCIMRKSTTVSFNLRLKLWMIGIFSQGLPFMLLFWSEKIISPGLTGILNATVSIWTFVISIIFAPKLTSFCLQKVVGLLIGILGVIVIFLPLVAIDNNLKTLLGAGAILIVTLSYAIGGLLNQHFLSHKNRIDFFANLYHQHWGSLGLLVISSLALETWPNLHTLSITPVAWLATMYLGVFSTAIAWILYYHLIREWDALRASTVLYIVPALTLIWDYLIYKNAPTISEIGGVIAILLGVISIQLSNFKQIIHRKN